MNFDRSPLLVIWEVTQACDLACVHCRASAQPDRHPNELSTEQGYRLLDEIRSFGEPLMVFREPADIGMAEEQTSDDVAEASLDGHGEVTANRKVPARHAMVGRVVSVPRIFGDVVAAHDGAAVKRRTEQRRISRKSDFLERLARRS